QLLRNFRSEKPDLRALREQPQGRLASDAKLLDIDASPDRARQSNEILSLIRQQLDLLTSPTIQWSGQAWPGASLEWRLFPVDVANQESEPQDEGANEDECKFWSSTLELDLPTLGEIKADIKI